MRILAIVGGVLASLATTTPATNGPGYAVYLTTHFDSNGWKVELKDWAPATGLAALAVASAAQWFTRSTSEAAAASLLSTVAWAVAAAELSRDFGESLPGPAVWLGWAAILAFNWSLALRPKPGSGL